VEVEFAETFKVWFLPESNSSFPQVIH
jgi:hypothetical protein